MSITTFIAIQTDNLDFADQKFDPEAIRVMDLAFETARRSLHLADKTDSFSSFLTKILASKIIKAASDGERDPGRLRDAVLTSFSMFDS